VALDLIISRLRTFMSAQEEWIRMYLYWSKNDEIFCEWLMLDSPVCWGNRRTHLWREHELYKRNRKAVLWLNVC
jgi:hypothetical protein